MRNNVIKFKKRPKKIEVFDIDSIGIIFKNNSGVIIPKKFYRQLLQVLIDNNADYYIED